MMLWLKSEIIESVIFCIFLFSLLFIDLLRLLCGSENYIINFFRVGIFLSIFIYVVGRMVYLNQIIKYLPFMIISIFIFISSLGMLYENESVFWFFCSQFIGKAFIGFYLASEVKLSLLRKILEKFILISVAYSIVCLYQYSSYDYIYMMNMSYNLILPAMFSFLFYLEDKKVQYLIYTLLFCTSILMYGSRGPFVCFIVCIFSYLILNRKFLSVTIFISTILVVGLVLCSTDILLLFIDDIQRYRTIAMFMNSELFSTTGRSEIWYYCIDYLFENPVLPLGVLGDRNLVSYLFEDEVSFGMHPHSIVIEILLQFGLLTGLLIIFFIIFNFVIGIKYAYGSKNTMLKQLFCIMFSLGFFKLLYSSSYLIAPEFWIFMAIIGKSYCVKYMSNIL